MRAVSLMATLSPSVLYRVQHMLHFLSKIIVTSARYFGLGRLLNRSPYVVESPVESSRIKIISRSDVSREKSLRDEGATRRNPPDSEFIYLSDLQLEITSSGDKGRVYNLQINSSCYLDF